MIRGTHEAIEAYCVAVGLVVYEWNDLHEQLARLFALVREGDRQESLTEWYAIRSDTRQREKLRSAVAETTSGRWKKSPRAPDDLKWLLDRADKLASDLSLSHAPCSLYLRGDGSLIRGDGGGKLYYSVPSGTLPPQLVHPLSGASSVPE